MKTVLARTLLVMLVLFSLAGSSIGQINMLCKIGDTRPCGSSVGECQKGTSICTDSIWGDCEGNIEPVDEICGDGLDNDCNGLVDDCGFNTASIILIGSGCMLLLVALILNKLGK